MNQQEFDAVFNLPFAEASSFFRKKLNIPTAAWDDVWKGQHALGFMSAGAAKAELLADLRGAVQKSIDGKMGLKEFQGKFDQIVKTHGWSYNGGRNWRSELIWDTNITTAYQAGRWEQFQAGGAEYLMYLHADGVQNPRPLHVSWSGKVLPITDAWWGTHYPPNGWKCHCRAVRSDRAEWAKAKATGNGEAPKDGSYEWVNKRTGEIHTIPNGIDPGWDYNVGKAAGRSYRVLADKFETLPRDISRAWMKEHVAGPAFSRFVEGKIPGQFPVAVLKEADQAVLKTQTQTVWLDQETLAKDLTLADYQLIPAIIDAGDSVGKKGERTLELLHNGTRYRLTLAGNKVSALKKDPREPKGK